MIREIVFPPPPGSPGGVFFAHILLILSGRRSARQSIITGQIAMCDRQSKGNIDIRSTRGDILGNEQPSHRLSRLQELWQWPGDNRRGVKCRSYSPY